MGLKAALDRDWDRLAEREDTLLLILNVLQARFQQLSTHLPEGAWFFDRTLANDPLISSGSFARGNHVSEKIAPENL